MDLTETDMDLDLDSFDADTADDILAALEAMRRDRITLTDAPTEQKVAFPTAGQVIPAFPTAGQDASPTEQKIASPTAGQDASPTEQKVASPTAGQDASPTEQENASPTEQENASPAEQEAGGPIELVDTSPAFPTERKDAWKDALPLSPRKKGDENSFLAGAVAFLAVFLTIVHASGCLMYVPLVLSVAFAVTAWSRLLAAGGSCDVRNLFARLQEAHPAKDR
jgi:hypothetical protein